MSTFSTPSSSSSIASDPSLPAPCFALFEPPSAERLEQLRSSPPPTLNSFLRSIRSVLELNPRPPHLFVVFGNEACDLDSVVSAITLAYFLQLAHGNGDRAFLPLINMKRDELQLRGETPYVLSRAGIDPSLLLFRDDLDLVSLAATAASGGSSAQLDLILVDHNHLQSSYRSLGPHVCAIVDHHKDERLYPRSFHNGNRVLDTVASCTTLVAELVLRHVPFLLGEESMGTLDASNHAAPPTPQGILSLLHAALLLDSDNMSPHTRKGTARDEALLREYEARMRNISFADLKRRRADTSQLSTAQLLAKDTKYGESVAYPNFVCSVPGSLADWARRDPAMLARIDETLASQQMRFAVVLTQYTDPRTNEYFRQLMLVVRRRAEAQQQARAADAPPLLDDEALFQTLQRTLEQAKLELNAVPNSNLLPPEAHANAPPTLLYQPFEQRNLHASRKQVAPLLAQLLSKL